MGAATLPFLRSLVSIRFHRLAVLSLYLSEERRSSIGGMLCLHGTLVPWPGHTSLLAWSAARPVATPMPLLGAMCLPHVYGHLKKQQRRARRGGRGGARDGPMHLPGPMSQPPLQLPFAPPPGQPAGFLMGPRPPPGPPPTPPGGPPGGMFGGPPRGPPPASVPASDRQLLAAVGQQHYPFGF